MRKHKSIIFVGILVLAFAGFVVYKALSSSTAKQSSGGGGMSRGVLPVNMLVVKPESFTETLVVMGSVEANESVVLKSEVSGLVTGIFFKEGERVKEGALLLKVYDDDLQAQLSKAQANLKLVEGMESRQRQLLDRKLISLQEYEVAHADLQAAQADVALLMSHISKTEIRAPFDGCIGFRNVSPSELVTPGVDIASLVNGDPAKIQFTVPERYSRLLGSDTTIRYRIEGENLDRTATVYAMAPYIDKATRQIELKALSPNSDEALIPGAFAKIEVLLETRHDVILIPAEAILSESAGEKIYLYRDGQVVPVMVESGVRTNDRVEITRGIEPGDTLITTGLMQITPRTTVTPAVKKE